MDNEKIISEITGKWDARKELITRFFQNRDKEAIVKPMGEAIDDYLTFLLLMNDKEETLDKKMLQDNLIGLDYSPINLDERLSFIIKKPNQYHAFVQLNELYHESLKLYAKMKILTYKK